MLSMMGFLGSDKTLIQGEHYLSGLDRKADSKR